MTRADRAYYVAQQRLVRDLTNTAHAAWSDVDPAVVNTTSGQAQLIAQLHRYGYITQ